MENPPKKLMAAVSTASDKLGQGSGFNRCRFKHGSGFNRCRFKHGSGFNRCRLKQVLTWKRL